MTTEAAETLAARAAARLGREVVRLPDAADAIDEVVPRLIVEPADAEGVAATLAWAQAERLRVAPRGGGTKIDWGSPPSGIDAVLSLKRLDRVVDHWHGDLTATVQAGATLGTVNAELGRRGQWIPLDPAWPDRATLGGIVATNDSGPRRQRHGTPRDLLIGVQMARADGQLAKAGGRVVKNVAGYDLGKLLAGSFGCLGVIVGATFKLAPVPPASRTVTVELPSTETLCALVLELAASPLAPSAVELAMPDRILLVRFESIAAAAERQAADLIGVARACGARTAMLAGAEEEALWRHHAGRPWQRSGAVLKVGLLPADLADTVSWLERRLAELGADHEIVGRAGVGALLLRIDAALETQTRLVSELRARFVPGRGSAIVLRGHAELKRRVDVWGPIGDALGVMRAVKARFDPAGILNPGRGPGAI